MPTTVHLPPPLLESIDRQARELGMSRNRYIVRALERCLKSETQWSRELVDELKAATRDEEAHAELAAMRIAIAANRTRKAPPEL